MRKAKLFSIDGKQTGEVELPVQFEEPFRPDLIQRAVLSLQSHNYQPHGTDPRAGIRQGRTLSKQRHSYTVSYGHSMSRIRRKALWKRGSQFGWVGAFVVSAVKGHRAFPPKVEKIISQKINKKERRKAIRSAIAGAKSIAVENKFENLKKTKEVMITLEKLGFEKELARTKEKKVRAGKGKMRGRKYRRKKGLLIIASKECPLLISARGIPGIDAVAVKNINTQLLAPGANPGRQAIWTQDAIKVMKDEQLFM